MEVDAPFTPSTSRPKEIVDDTRESAADNDENAISQLNGSQPSLSRKDSTQSRKRLTEFRDEDDCSSVDLSDNIRQKPDILTYVRTPGVYKYRRRVSTEPKIDYFAVYNIPTTIIHHIFTFLNKKDLVNSMCACSRFYIAGVTATNWYRIDLYQKAIPENTLITLMKRKTKVVRLSEAMITPSIKGRPIDIPGPLEDSLAFHLTHLDLGRAAFSNQKTMIHILNSCQKLKGLCLESHILDDEGEICNAIGNNPDLQFLDMSLVRGLTPLSMESICKCRKLRHLNFSWSNLDPESVSLLCLRLPPSLTHINLAGTQDRNSILDEDVINLCTSCPNLIECDLSDNISIFDQSLDALLNLEELEVLSLSRCYGIDPINFMACGHILHLNIFGTMTEDGERVLRMNLPRTQINTSVFNHIAKPTVPPSISSIWNQKTRDLCIL